MTVAPESPPAGSGRRRTLIFAAKLIVSAALLTLLVTRSDVPRLWTYVRGASVSWLAAALALYLVMILASAWRWGLLLGAQGVSVPARRLTESFLVATFFNNFLPSNIGGDVIRIADTAPAARSRTLAATVVIVDRGLGLLGVVLLAAIAATLSRWSGRIDEPVSTVLLWCLFIAAAGASAPALLSPGGVIKLLSPLRMLHPEWVGARLETLTEVLTRFREAPGALIACFGGAVLVQALLVAFYAAVAQGIGINMSPWHMAVIVPLSFLVQLAPISLNGFGVREAVFAYYFARLGATMEGGLVVSLLGAGLVMLFSLSGGLAYALRKA